MGAGPQPEPKVTNAYRQVHLLYPPFRGGRRTGGVTNAYRQVHLLYDDNLNKKSFPASQMPIGKYIYCTFKRGKLLELWEGVTNAYRQVHLLYNENRFIMICLPSQSQMPIGKYIYCTGKNNAGNSVACVTNAYRQVHLLYSNEVCEKYTITSHKCLSASTFTVRLLRRSPPPPGGSHKCLSASTFTVPPPPGGRRTGGNRHKCLSASTFTVRDRNGK